MSDFESSFGYRVERNWGDSPTASQGCASGILNATQILAEKFGGSNCKRRKNSCMLMNGVFSTFHFADENPNLEAFRS